MVGKIRSTMSAILVANVAMHCMALPANASKIEVIPSLALEESWDSNIFNTSSDERSDYISRFKPRLDIQFATFQTTMKFGGGVQAEWYPRHSSLSSWSGLKNLDLTASEPLQVTPRLSIRPFASFVESDDPVRRNELTQLPNPDVPPPEALIIGRVKTRDYRGFLGTGYLLTPRADLSVSGGVTRRDFSGNGQGVASQGISLEDSTRLYGDAAVFYGITPRLSCGFFGGAGFNSYEKSPDSKTYTGGMGGRYRLTPANTLILRVGAGNIVQSGSATVTETDRWFPYGRLAVRYTWQILQVTFAGFYDVAGAAVFGKETNRVNISVSITHQLTEKLAWNISGFYQNSRSFDKPATVDVDTMQGTASISYAAFRWATFFLNGNMARQNSRGVSESDVGREAVVLGALLNTAYEAD